MKHATRTNRILAILIAILLALPMLVHAVGAASAPNELQIAYCNLSFENDTHLMYAIRSADPNVRLLVWSEPQADYRLGTQKTVLTPMSEQMTINGEPYTVFKYTGLAAKQMTDEVYVRAYIDNGDEGITYGNVHKYSILQYAYNKLGKTGQATTDEKLIRMLQEMLEYGAAAQEYHGYKTDRLATDAFAQVVLTGGSLPDGSSYGLYRVGETVLISAPAQNAEGTAFTRWKDQNGATVAETAVHTLTVGATNNTYTPEYVAYSQGLEFESYDDGTCYLAGMGTFTGTELIIPSVSPAGDVVVEIDADIASDITSITIPKSVVTIAKNAFSASTSLTDVYYDGTEEEWEAIDISTRGNTALINATKHFATPPVVEPTYSEPTIEVQSVEATAGGTEVTVDVKLHKNPGVASLVLSVAFDADLILTDVIYNTEIGGQTVAPESMSSPATLYWVNGLAETGGDWTFVTLKFKVSDTAAKGDHAITLSYDPNNVYNIREENIHFAVVNGKIHVK